MVPHNDLGWLVVPTANSLLLKGEVRCLDSVEGRYVVFLKGDENVTNTTPDGVWYWPYDPFGNGHPLTFQEFEPEPVLPELSIARTVPISFQALEATTYVLQKSPDGGKTWDTFKEVTPEVDDYCQITIAAASPSTLFRVSTK